MLRLGIYADLKRLYWGQDTDTIQQSLLESVAKYREIGIEPVNNHPSFVFFPTVREYDFFIGDMRKQGCIPHEKFTPISTAQEVILQHPVNVEKMVSDGRDRLFLAMTVSYSLDNGRVIDHINMPELILKAVEQAVEQVLLLGISGTGEFSMMARGLKVEITALDFKQSQLIKKTGVWAKLFAPFDWLFDWIDKVFAGGSGTDFNLMGEILLPENRALIHQAVKEVLFTALDDNYIIESRDLETRIRVLMEERQVFLDELDQIDGVNVLDDFHDGTYWTFDIGLKTQTFYNNRTFADVLKRTNAEIIHHKTLS